MAEELKPCHCGYEGELLGMNHQGVCFSLSCPKCSRDVTAFTIDGLIESWNAEPVAAQEKEATQ